jgi:hypothetical protein
MEQSEPEGPDCTARAQPRADENCDVSLALVLCFRRDEKARMLRRGVKPAQGGCGYGAGSGCGGRADRYSGASPLMRYVYPRVLIFCTP